MKVAVVGAAGGIGQTLSLTLTNHLPSHAELALYDISPVTPGIATDLNHIPSPIKVTGFGGNDPTPALEGADVVVISAGLPRKPGMTRADLFLKNAEILSHIAERIAHSCPKALVATITNPVNSIVPVVRKVLAQHGVYDPARVFGVTTLDVMRSQTFVGDARNIDPSTLRNLRVIGGHSGNTILPLLSQLNLDFSADECETLTNRIRNAGTEVVEAKAGGGSATLSMGQAAGQFCLSLVDGLAGKGGAEVCSYVDDGGQYAGYFALPVVLGPNGIAEIKPIGPMSDYEQEQFEQLLPTLKDDIAQSDKL